MHFRIKTTSEPTLLTITFCECIEHFRRSMKNKETNVLDMIFNYFNYFNVQWFLISRKSRKTFTG